MCSYKAIDESGMPILNTYVNKGDCIVGKVTKIVNSKKNKNIKLFEKEYIDKSLYLNSEGGYIDKVLLSKNQDGRQFIKIRIRSIKIPIIGDKFASRSAQKGTIGMLLSEKDMPFDKNGLKPDIIINPNAIPSRMTIAQILETILGNSCIKLGNFGNGDAFQNIDIDSHIKQYGDGNSTLYTGNTMNKFNCFIGCVYYQRLKHVVSEKINARATGAVTQMCRQPVDGRSNNGGLRVGAMENDCLVAHGISSFQKEKSVDLSDKFKVNINQNGQICIFNKEKQLINSFSSDSKIKSIEIPYALKLLYHELQAMGIGFGLK